MLGRRLLDVASYGMFIRPVTTGAVSLPWVSRQGRVNATDPLPLGNRGAVMKSYSRVLRLALFGVLEAVGTRNARDANNKQKREHDKHDHAGFCARGRKDADHEQQQGTEEIQRS
jgi:hypothetical protein